MRRLFLIAFVALQCLAGDVRSQGTSSPEALAAAKELAAIVSQDTINQLSQAMTAQIWPKLQAELGSQADPATLNELRGEFEKAMARFLVEVMKDAPEIYARHFTAEELRDIVAFYRTPSGKKALQTMPKVTAETFQVIGPRLETFQRDIAGILQRFLKKPGGPR